MIQLFDMWLSFFAEKTGLAGKLFLNAQTVAAILVLLGICLVLAGIRVYRLLTSALLFGATAVVICICMAGNADWRATVTAFTIIGCLLAFAAYSWKLLDAVIFSALAAAALLWHGCPLWWAACIAGILAGGGPARVPIRFPRYPVFKVPGASSAPPRRFLPSAAQGDILRAPPPAVKGLSRLFPGKGRLSGRFRRTTWDDAL